MFPSLWCRWSRGHQSSSHNRQEELQQDLRSCSGRENIEMDDTGSPKTRGWFCGRSDPSGPRLPPLPSPVKGWMDPGPEGLV